MSGTDGGAGLGHVAEVLLFHNTGTVACTLTGYPGVAGLSAQGVQLVQAVRQPNGYMGGLTIGESMPPRVLVGPQRTVSALVEGTDMPVGTETTCESYPALLVTPPGFTTSTTVVIGSGGASGGFPGCSIIEIHPVVAGTNGRED